MTWKEIDTLLEFLGYELKEQWETPAQAPAEIQAVLAPATAMRKMGDRAIRGAPASLRLRLNALRDAILEHKPDTVPLRVSELSPQVALYIRKPVKR